MYILTIQLLFKVKKYLCRKQKTINKIPNSYENAELDRTASKQLHRKHPVCQGQNLLR